MHRLRLRPRLKNPSKFDDGECRLDDYGNRLVSNTKPATCRAYGSKRRNSILAQDNGDEAIAQIGFERSVPPEERARVRQLFPEAYVSDQ